MRQKKYSIKSGWRFSGVINFVTEDIYMAAIRDGSMVLIEGDSKGVVVTCAEGVASLTQPSDPEDHILPAGETFIIDRRGLVVITALADTCVFIRSE